MTTNAQQEAALWLHSPDPRLAQGQQPELSSEPSDVLVEYIGLRHWKTGSYTAVAFLVSFLSVLPTRKEALRDER